MNKLIIAIVVIGIAIIGMIYIKGTSLNPLAVQISIPPSTQPTPPTAPGPTSTDATLIHMTASGFSPNDVTIKKGDTVTFVSDSGSPHWPASAIHPTHTVYPGSDIKKCNTAEEKGIFDACRGLNIGESWSFTVHEVGIWRYHDHLAASLYGKITVTP